MLRHEGVRALYKSYRTTLVMNVPFTAVHFGVYEAAKRMLLHASEQEEGLLVQVRAQFPRACNQFAVLAGTPWLSQVVAPPCSRVL
jgi:hypothetical protein